MTYLFILGLELIRLVEETCFFAATEMDWSWSSQMAIAMILALGFWSAAETGCISWL